MELCIEGKFRAWTLEMEGVCIVRVKGGSEMVFQELDYSRLVGLEVVNEVTWESISESKYMIKVEGDTLSSYKTCE